MTVRTQLTTHQSPPATPAGILLHHPAIIALVVTSSITLAILAMVDGGSVLLIWDEPIQLWVEDHRTDQLDNVFRVFSRMGSNVFLFLLLIPLLLLLYGRCHAMALTLLVAVLARPPLEFVIKDVIGRDRPDFDRMVNGVGFSHPSGHVLAAVTMWGLLPPIVASLTHRHWWWYISAGVATLMIPMIAASRVYLGVHWFSDVVQSFLLGSLYLLLVEMVLDWHHRKLPTCVANRHLFDE
jgi:undecaprenyl-diphosphatase